jgi:hypothetical protein
VSGRIRAPDAAESRADHVWRVSADLPAAGEKSARAPGTSARPASWVRIRVDDLGHTVVARGVPGPRSAASFAHGEPDWSYSLLDADGAVIASGVTHDPRIWRSTVSAPGQPQAGHGHARLESGIYYVGIPRGSAPRKLRITALSAGHEKSTAGSPARDAIEIDLDTD